MTFAIETATKSKLNDVIVLSQKNREPNDNPGAQLSFSMQVANDSLAMLDGALKGFLYTRYASSSTAEQGTLEGVPEVSDAPNLTTIGKRVGKLHWDIELSGFTLTIDHGMGGASNIEIPNCVLSKFRLHPQEGGTVLVDFQLESQDVAAQVFGKLATLKNREVEILLAPPEVVQDDIEDTKPRRQRKASAAGKGAAAGDGEQDDGAWPFPGDGTAGDGFPAGSPEAAFTGAQD